MKKWKKENGKRRPRKEEEREYDIWGIEEGK